MSIAEKFGYPILSGFRVGCEFEIESILDMNSTWFAKHGVNVTTDHSLREEMGSAREFITKPVDLNTAVSIHNSLYNDESVLTFHSKGNPCSDRCSIHVHVNMSDQSSEKVRQFILMYALLEPLFFELVDESRKNNIYCVPLSFTFLNKHYACKDLETLIDKWASGSYKYTAFNIIPLGKQGSVEFRHLQGTKNNAKFKDWLEAIFRLYKLNQATSLSNETLTKHWAHWAAQTVFNGLVPPIVLSDVALNNMLENTYFDVKLGLLEPSKEMVLKRIKEANAESVL